MEKEIEMEREAVVIGAGGAVNSVNGQTGDVVLTTSDLENTSDYQTGTEVESAISTAIAGIDIPTKTSDLTNDGATGTSTYVEATALSAETTAREQADNALQSQIDAISASSDVTDIVGTKAELNAYDTSKLGDNDIIKVLQDESENGETTYYRWSTTTQSFTLIGEEGPYYTKSQADVLLNAKQNTLTAGSNVSIVNNTISATDTTYTAGNGLALNGTQFSADTTVLATQTDLASKQDTLTAGTGIDITNNVISATSTGPTVVQTTGTSTTNVMSQKAVTSMVFADPSTQRVVFIGGNSFNTRGSYGVSVGYGATTSNAASVAIGGSSSYNNGTLANDTSVAVGTNAKAGYASNGASIGGKAVAVGGESLADANGAVAIGYKSAASTQGEMNIGTSDTRYGYNSSNYRLLTGLYDGQSAHDAATVGQLNTAIAGAGANEISSTDWSALWQ